jgi:hypothetical protein
MSVGPLIRGVGRGLTDGVRVMGTIVRFPQTQHIASTESDADEGCKAASIIILPVIRIERQVDGASRLEPSRTKPGHKRRRRTLRE